MQNLPNNASNWQRTTPQTSSQTPTNGPERMPPEKARRRAKSLKRLAFAGTTLTFCALAGLAANHVTGVTSANAAGAATATPSNQDDHGRFFPGDGRGSDDGEQQNDPNGGYNFGSGSGSFQPPASSSSGS